jgi:hypothetical protein
MICRRGAPGARDGIIGGCAAAQPTGKRAKVWNRRWKGREKKSGWVEDLGIAKKNE